MSQDDRSRPQWIPLGPCFPQAPVSAGACCLQSPTTIAGTHRTNDVTSERGSIHNLILIRYNMAPPVEWQADGRNLDPLWLEERQTLFRRYCLPGLKLQPHGTTVLLFFDERTPPDYIAAICDQDNLVPVLTSAAANSSEAMLSKVVRGTAEWTNQQSAAGTLLPGDVVSTTRLDNDDAIAGTYLTLANAAYIDKGCPPIEYVYFPTGQEFLASDGSYYRRHYPKNAFGTLYERWNGSPLRTVLHCQHTALLAEHAGHSSALQPPLPQWCIIVHGNNVRNHVRGTPLQAGYFPVG